MSGVTATLRKIARRALLIGVAATPASFQGVTTPRFAVTYESPPRVIPLRPPTGEVLSCNWSAGVIVVSREEVLERLRARIESTRSDPHASQWWSSKLDRVVRDERARSGDCTIPRAILAEILERGHATVVGASGSPISQIAVSGVAWVHDGRPAFYSYGDGRAFTTIGSHYRPDPEGPDCGAGCIVYSGDHQSHSNFVI